MRAERRAHFSSSRSKWCEKCPSDIQPPGIPILVLTSGWRDERLFSALARDRP
ncbi:hypothetical protein SS05631_c30050 [Sinorhizobium sp. CCBAU 05631]|nr:hypothetical protein SS05631_c30050 [Sinorhizobium sp. CCBAU 05631]